jgi:hypothetical protein
VRIAAADESDAGFRRIVFTTREAARKAAVLLAEHPVAVKQLRDLGHATGSRLVAWTIEELYAGRLKLLSRIRRLGSATAPAASPPPPPSSRLRTPASPAAEMRDRRPAPTLPAAEAPAYSTFPQDLDAAAVAQSLVAAASDGIPFCEECMKAAKVAPASASIGAT